MTQIDKSKPVLVTGATGYIAGWLIKKLLEKGLTVHAAVRNPDARNKLEHLDAMAEGIGGQIRYFRSDLLVPGSYEEAMKGCELVFHTASPFTVNVEDPQKELIEPAVLGTRNVLEQANRTESVKRIVLTSSCAAIYTDCTDVQNAPNGILTEEIWNTTASMDYQPYSYSKTLAEKEAWKINEQQSRWDLVVINPCMVMGPALNPRTTISESINLLTQMGDGTYKMGTANIGCGLVDVRDVAEAHFLAAFTPGAEGRHITCGHSTSFFGMSKALFPKYGNDYPLPKRAIPKALLLIVGPMMNKFITRKYIRNNVNLGWKADNSKSILSLGLSYRPMEETMNEAFQSLIDSGIFDQKKA